MNEKETERGHWREGEAESMGESVYKDGRKEMRRKSKEQFNWNNWQRGCAKGDREREREREEREERQ